MEKVRLSLEVDPGIRRRVSLAAAANEQSVEEWLEDAVENALESTSPVPPKMKDVSAGESAGDGEAGDGNEKREHVLGLSKGPIRAGAPDASECLDDYIYNSR